MNLYAFRPLLCAIVFSAAAIAQPETFEVASIKLGDPLSPGTSFNLQAGGGLKVDNASLKSLITFAYDIRDFQLAGVTGWFNSERFNILAKGTGGDGPAEYGKMSDAQRRAMTALVRKRLQALLADRFQLAIHRETKDLPVYVLVIAKNGLKMQPSNTDDKAPTSMSMGNAMYKGQRARMDQIAHGLSSLVGRPVEDETGLQGFYDFKMEWTPDAAPAGPGATEGKTTEVFGPTLFTALQEQLGLKLESRKGSVEILNIDRAERPSEN